MKNVNASSNVFAFGGIDGGRNALFSTLDEAHLKRVYDYCKRVREKTGLNINEYLSNRNGPQNLETIFMEWCITYILDCILFEMYMEKENEPDILLGYSLGLNTALYCSQCIEFEDGITILEGIKECVRESYRSGNKAMGIMIGITEDDIERILIEQGYSQEVRIASYNSEYCNVISGNKMMIEQVLEIARELGCLRTKLLNVPFAFHFGEINQDIEKYLVKIKDINMKAPKVAIFSVYSQDILTKVEEVRKELEINVYSTIKWKQSIARLEDLGYRRFWDVSADGTVKKISMLMNEDARFSTYKSISK